MLYVLGLMLMRSWFELLVVVSVVLIVLGIDFLLLMVVCILILFAFMVLLIDLRVIGIVDGLLWWFVLAFFLWWL